jgi:hypothetical protein
MDLRAMGELERTGQLVATSAESEYEQYKTAVAEMSKPTTAAVKKDYLSIHDLATPDAKKKFGLDGSGKGKAASGGGGGGLVAVIFLGAAGLAVLSVFVPAVVLVNIIVGIAVAACGQIWGAVLAFLDDVVSGMLYMFLPIYPLIYLGRGGSRTRGALLLWLGGIALIFMTAMAGSYGASLKGH